MSVRRVGSLGTVSSTDAWATLLDNRMGGDPWVCSSIVHPHLRHRKRSSSRLLRVGCSLVPGAFVTKKTLKAGAAGSYWAFSRSCVKNLPLPVEVPTFQPTMPSCTCLLVVSPKITFVEQKENCDSCKDKLEGLKLSYRKRK
jgi:hypothetical protein